MVRIVDRAKDMINRGGENVYSVEVENVLAAHPDVLEVAVVGVADPVMGEKVGAVVLPREGAEDFVPSLIAFARERLADYKVPQFVRVLDDALPRNAGGKVLKTTLRGSDDWIAVPRDRPGPRTGAVVAGTGCVRARPCRAVTDDQARPAQLVLVAPASPLSPHSRSGGVLRGISNMPTRGWEKVLGVGGGRRGGGGRALTLQQADRTADAGRQDLLARLGADRPAAQQVRQAGLRRPGLPR